MRKKKKSCGCSNQMNTCNNKNMNYCAKKENKCEDKCACKTNPIEYNTKSCIPDKTINAIDSCKPTKCKTKIKEYTCPYEDCEIKYEDTCSDLAKKAEELFDKAVKYEKKAECTLKEAKELEQNAKNLSQKSCNLMQNAKEADKQAKNATCSAQDLMNKAEELCCKAKCLYKEAKELEQEAQENCQNAKCAYEKAENYNQQAKYLFNQTLKYEQKTLECYKNAEDKIKEIGGKSKKCQDLINKCNSKLNNCMDSCIEEEKPKKSCGCNIYDKVEKVEKENCGFKTPKDICGCNNYSYNDYGCKNDENDIIQLKQENNCNCTCNTSCQYSYINPMYDMMPMQYMGNMSNEYITMETPYITTFDENDNMNDMWNNYYMYIQKMIQSMKDN